VQSQATKPAAKRLASPGKARALAAAIHNQQQVNVAGPSVKPKSTRNQNRLLFEDEYHDEVTAYMHSMEVSCLPYYLGC
jgi:hypothetical protein